MADSFRFPCTINLAKQSVASKAKEGQIGDTVRQKANSPACRFFVGRIEKY